jgi:hypothetical protein
MERTHYFSESADCFITRTTQKGEYIAYLTNPPGNVFERGKGLTRWAAVADLVEKLSGFDDRFIYDLDSMAEH